MPAEQDQVVARPGWDSVDELALYPIGVPAGSIVTLADIGLVLPTSWNLSTADTGGPAQSDSISGFLRWSSCGVQAAAASGSAPK